MHYNFDELIERKHTNSYKWDDNSNEEVLPMWVADMDFRTAQPIIDALTNRVQHGIFGYAKPPQAFYQATIDWYQNQHQFSIQKEWLIYTIGVVPAISAIIKAMTQPGDKVLVQGPVYNCFFSSIRNNGCEMVSNDLKYENGAYTVDFEDLAIKAADPETKLLLLCSPHNPVGRVWTKEELVKIGTICKEHNVFVVADEIHCDLVISDKKHIPFASISEEFLNNSVTCIAPSKTFNLAGLQVANIVVNNPELKQKIDKAININEVCDISPFAVEGLMAAYTQGGEWLSQLKPYLKSNFDFLKTFFSKYLPEFPVMNLEATYLVWVDCNVLGLTSQELSKIILDNENLRINAGTLYGEAGEGFIRINIACPKARLEDALHRLKVTLSGLPKV